MTPFAWSQPHDGERARRRRRGGAAPTRARGDRARALRPRGRPARGPARASSWAARTPLGTSSRSAPPCPISRRSRLGRSGRRAREPRARARTRPLRRRPRLRARPAEPLVSRAARHRGAHGRDLLLARPPRLPAGQAQREKLLGRDRRAARDIARRRPRRRRSASRATTALSPHGVDSALRARHEARERFVLEWRAERAAAPARRLPRARRAARLGARLSCGRSRSPAGPYVPRALATASRVRTARDGTRPRADPQRAPRSSSPPRRANARLPLEAAAAGGAVADPPGVSEQPELAAPRSPGSPRTTRCARGAAATRGSRRGRELRAARGRARASSTARPRQRRRGAPQAAEPLADRDWIVADLHMHTRWSHDCADRRCRAARPRRGGGARRDRGHRPQRLRRRARGGRARARPRADRHPRRGGQDRRPGRGDRALPRARRSRAA